MNLKKNVLVTEFRRLVSTSSCKLCVSSMLKESTKNHKKLKKKIIGKKIWKKKVYLLSFSSMKAFIVSIRELTVTMNGKY